MDGYLAGYVARQCTDGIPTGNTVDDLFGTSVECGTTFPDGKGGPGGDCETRLPAFDIAFKMIRAFRELGDTWVAMGAAPQPGQPANLTAEGHVLIQEAAALENDVSVLRFRCPACQLQLQLQLSVPLAGLERDLRLCECCQCCTQCVVPVRILLLHESPPDDRCVPPECDPQ